MEMQEKKYKKLKFKILLELVMEKVQITPIFADQS